VVWPQNQQLQFGDLTHKITTIVSWFGPQNQVGYDLSVALQNQREDEDNTGHALKSHSLLCLEASQARVSQSSLRLVEVRRRWCTWHHRESRLEKKPRMDGSMRWAIREV
jgi:hypothetical protein